MNILRRWGKCFDVDSGDRVERVGDIEADVAACTFKWSVPCARMKIEPVEQRPTVPTIEAPELRRIEEPIGSEPETDRKSPIVVASPMFSSPTDS